MNNKDSLGSFVRQNRTTQSTLHKDASGASTRDGDNRAIWDAILDLEASRGIDVVVAVFKGTQLGCLIADAERPNQVSTQPNAKAEEALRQIGEIFYEYHTNRNS